MSKLAVMPLEDYKNACNKIREHLGGEPEILSGEMALEIGELYSQTYETAYNAGDADGYVIGYQEGYADGQEAGGGIDYDLFWDNFQENGNRINYQFGFANVWNDDIYNPKYPIVCSGQYINATSLFAKSSITDTKVPITISGSAVRADTMFQDCTELKRIPSLTFNGFARFSNTFSGCKALEEMNVYGVIDVGGMDVSASTKLNKQSWISIINALSSDTSGLSMTGSLTSVKKAFETVEGANDGDTSTEWLNLKATKSNWGVSLK